MTTESMTRTLAPLAVCILPEPRLNASRTVSYPTYLHEIFGHAGLCYSPVAVNALADALPQLSILVTVGEYALSPELLAQLQAWVAAGGQWIAVAGVCGAAELFGVALEPAAYRGFGGGGSNNLGEGYLQPLIASRLLEHIPLPLHFFNGLPVQVTDATVLATVLDKHQRTTNRAALTMKMVEKGCCVLLTPDLTGTVVRIQQGLSVTRDGVSAPDGSAPVGDSVLKSGDGAVLDWIFDRQPVPDIPGLHAFLQPIADLWRELLLRTLFDALERADVLLPLLWLYPENRPALAHLSHDTDQNDPALGQKLLEVVGEAGILSTWCVIVPGYPPDLMARIQAAGHELAMHYDAMSDDCPWSHTLFHEQWETLVALFGHKPVSNKNHYLRWEGDIDFFQWCEEHGIELDQSKGASKTGEAGYNFGTCHLAFPVAFDGTPLNVLELPTPTQDFEIFAPHALFYPLLDAALRTHGVLHLLFHPAHIAKPGVADSILTAVATAQEQGLAWWTAAQLNAWERARRQAVWQWQASAAGAPSVQLQTIAPLVDATILWRGRPEQAPPTALPVHRWGFDFYAMQVTLPANSTSEWLL
ncbi:MAG: hypothetical protein KF832_01065 [Caldilineaceae bacterium]|nr:hypothetical protein [Caldilineaceae bacterium]